MERLGQKIEQSPWLARIFLTMAVLASVIPFSNRAVFIDEHLYLNLAQSALAHPLFPSDTPKLFFGNLMPNFSAHTHPPVGEYCLAAIYALTGTFREVPFRLIYSIFAIAAVLAFYSLARRFTEQPFLVALLFAVSPAFLVFAPALMMDVPMLAFLLAGLAFYFQGRLIPASLGFVLAAGTGYTCLVPLACLFLVMVISKRPLRELACVAAAPVILFAWLMAMTAHFGEFPLTKTVEFYKNQGSMVRNLLATLSFIGGMSVFPGAVRLRTMKSMLVAFAAAAGLSLFVPMPSTLYRLWFVVLATCGLMVLAAFIRSAWDMMIHAEKNRGEAVLFLWAPAVLLFFIVVADMVNARYILLALPAIYLVVFRDASRFNLTATIIATAILALTVAYADALFVNSYRTWTRETIPPLQDQGFRVWDAAESGFRFYMEQTGAQTLSTLDTRPAGADLIVRQGMFRYSLSEHVEMVSTPLKRFQLTNSFPVRTFNAAAGAGLHDNRIGLVPYIFSRSPYDEIDIAQISPLVKELPQHSTDYEQVPGWAPPGEVIFKQSVRERVFPLKIPSKIQIQYETDGPAYVEQIPGGLRLVNTSGKTIVWHRLRLTPAQFVESR